MQFPGMSTDPLRLQVAVTWWPPADDFSLSRHLWTRPTTSDVWQLEAMQTTASPVRLVELPKRWAEVGNVAIVDLLRMVESQMEPFPDL